VRFAFANNGQYVDNPLRGARQSVCEMHRVTVYARARARLLFLVGLASAASGAPVVIGDVRHRAAPHPVCPVRLRQEGRIARVCVYAGVRTVLEEFGRVQLEDRDSHRQVGPTYLDVHLETVRGRVIAQRWGRGVERVGLSATRRWAAVSQTAFLRATLRSTLHDQSKGAWTHTSRSTACYLSGTWWSINS